MAKFELRYATSNQPILAESVAPAERMMIINALRASARERELKARSHALTGPTFKALRADHRYVAKQYTALADKIEGLALILNHGMIL